MSSDLFGAHEWWHGLGTAERCHILVESGMPELQCLGLHLSGFELAELPSIVRGVVEAAWMRASQNF